MCKTIDTLHSEIRDPILSPEYDTVSKTLPNPVYNFLIFVVLRLYVCRSVCCTFNFIIFFFFYYSFTCIVKISKINSVSVASILVDGDEPWTEINSFTQLYR